VTSNAIVLVGIDDSSDRLRTDVASGRRARAVDKARAYAGIDALRAHRAPDAFYPFPDAVEVCLDAGVTAFVQPGGSMRDADTVRAADRAGGTMLVTGIRHFRH
jgi:phosphoribosylaminoimidazolecarboxamide formyltransferase/IMP cyclohydrolase